MSFDSNMFYIVLWIVLLILFIIVEIMSEALISIWFVVGAIPALILAVFKVGFITQALVFTIVSAIALIVSKKYINLSYDKSNIETNVNAMIGKIGYATDTINIDKKGYVKVDGLEWLAFTNEDTTIMKDDKVVVVGVEGVKIEIKKQLN